MKTNSMWASLTCQTSWREVNNQCNHINSQLELYKFLNIYINWTSPLGQCHNCGEIIIQDYHISILFSHLNLVKISWIVRNVCLCFHIVIYSPQFQQCPLLVQYRLHEVQGHHLFQHQLQQQPHIMRYASATLEYACPEVKIEPSPINKVKTYCY